MQKLIELSIIFAAIVIPAQASRVSNPRLGLRKALINMLLFEAFYVFAMRYIHGRFS